MQAHTPVQGKVMQLHTQQLHLLLTRCKVAESCRSNLWLAVVKEREGCVWQNNMDLSKSNTDTLAFTDANNCH